MIKRITTYEVDGKELTEAKARLSLFRELILNRKSYIHVLKRLDDFETEASNEG